MIKYRYFKVNLNILFFRFSSDTRVFKIRNNLVHIGLSIYYTLITIIFGLFSSLFSFPFLRLGKTLEALRVNIGGGMEFDKEMGNLEYDDKTNYVWSNLLRTTQAKINKDELDFILKIQNEFTDREKLYARENVNFIIIYLGRYDIHTIRTEEITDIFDALKLYERSLLEDEIA